MDPSASGQKTPPSGERFYRALLEITWDAVIVSDYDGVLIYAGPSIERVLGYPAEAMLGRTGLSVVHPEDRPSVAALRDQIRGHPGERGEVTFRAQHQDGSWHWIQVVGRNLLHDPAVGGLMIHFHDVTERVVAGAAQRTLLHDLRERVKELTAIHSVTRLLEAGGDETLPLLQQVAEALPPAWQYPDVAAARVKYGDLEFATATFAPSAWGQRAAFRAGGREGSIEVVYLQERPASAEGPFLAEERSLIDSLAEMLRAALERRAAEATRRESDARYRRLAENATDLIYRYEMLPERRWSYVNPAVRQVLGLDPHAFYADPNILDRYVHPDDREKQDALVDGRAAAAQAILRYHHVDGPLVWLDTHHSAVLDERGVVIAYEGIVRDVTAQRQREAAQQALSEIDRRMLRDESLDSVLNVVCQLLTRAFDFALAWIGLKQADGSVTVRAADGPAREFLRRVQIRWDETPQGGGPTGAVIRTGVPRVFDVQRDGRYFPSRDLALAHGLRSSLSLPLIVRGETIGALSLYSSRAASSREFGPATVELLSGFASQVGVSLLAAEHRSQIKLQAAALEAAANAIAITDHDGVIRWANPAFERLAGYGAGEAVGATHRLFESGARSEAFSLHIWETLRAGRVWQGEMVNRRRDGSRYTADQTITPVADPSGSITHFVAIEQDVSTRKRQEEQLRHLASHDLLTDLPNRQALQDALPQAIQQARHGRAGALLLLGLDNFKVINDTAGHAAGDRLLREVALMLQTVLLPTDLLARVGGDEFAMLLDDSPPSRVREIAEHMRGALDEFRFVDNGRTFTLTGSVGMVLMDGELGAERLLAVADAALLHAKQVGRNRVVLFRDEDARREALAETNYWATRLKDALREEQLMLYFQPIVRLANGALEHYEVLLRLREPDGRIVPPGAFLPSAERFGLMPAIDRWVVGRALATLRARAGLRLFVNLSGASLAHEELLDEVEALIESAGLEPGRLAFEITESVAMGNPARVRHWMQRLKQAGCQFALDDFGVGFSSFAYLQLLPTDYVKIDGSFVRDLDTNPTNRALVEAICAVAHTLGKETIAEWVENASIAALLRGLGVEFGQGYFWGKPMAEIAAPAARA